MKFIIDETGHEDMKFIEPVQDTQNCWGFGLRPLSGILQTRKDNVSGTGSVSVLR
jgi:hypothetical protein